MKDFLTELIIAESGIPPNLNESAVVNVFYACDMCNNVFYACISCMHVKIQKHLLSIIFSVNVMAIQERFSSVFSRVLGDSTPRFVGPSVGWSVGWLVPFLFFRRFIGFWAHSSFPNAIKSHSKSF